MGISGRNRLFMLTLLAAPAGAAIGAVAAVHQRDMVRFLVDDDALLVAGVPSDIELRIYNDHPWRQLEVHQVASTCGCTEVQGIDERVPPRSYGRIRLRSTIEPRMARLLQTVVVWYGDQPEAAVLLDRRPAEPFAGWPDRAECLLVDGGALLKVRPEYRAVISSAHVQHAKLDWRLPAQIHSDSILLGGILSEDEDDLLLVLTFGDSVDPNWSGTIKLRNFNGEAQ